MPLPDGYRFVPLANARRRDLLNLDVWAFPTGIAIDDMIELPLPLDWDRTVGVEAAGAQDGELAAAHSSYAFANFPVPGARTPVSGLTWVGVHPGHRRRGILRATIDRHFADCAERGEAISALFAAEAPIYGRFGYGLAATDLKLTIPRGAKLRPVAGSEDLTVRIEILDAERHGDLIAHVHRAAAEFPDGLNRPGWVSRETEALHVSGLGDAPVYRGGKEARRILIVERAGEPRGYATFRRSLEWADGGPTGPVLAREVVGLEPAATHRLWSVLLDLDLSSQVEVSMLPTDDPIMSLLVNTVAAVPRRSDNLWVRLVDVPAALAQRRYVTDVDVVLAVTDDVLPANSGSWHLRARALGEVSVERSTAEPALALSARELGAAYLGGVSLASLATAGLVSERAPETLGPASAAFAWPHTPVSNWVF